MTFCDILPEKEQWRYVPLKTELLLPVLLGIACGSQANSQVLDFGTFSPWSGISWLLDILLTWEVLGCVFFFVLSMPTLFLDVLLEPQCRAGSMLLASHLCYS